MINKIASKIHFLLGAKIVRIHFLLGAKTVMSSGNQVMKNPPLALFDRLKTTQSIPLPNTSTDNIIGGITVTILFEILYRRIPIPEIIVQECNMTKVGNAWLRLQMIRIAVATFPY